MEPRRVAPVALKEVARACGAELVGDGERRITGVRPFNGAREEDLTFLDPRNERLAAGLPGCRAAVITGSAVEIPPGLAAIRIDPPHLGLARALAFLYPPHRPALGVSPAAHLGRGVEVGPGSNVYPGAFLDEEVRVGSNTDIYPGVYIGRGSTIGSSCTLYPRVTIYHGTVIGDRVTIHSGAVIGADGFGYVPEPVAGDPREPIRLTKIPQVGVVVIEDDVEIGANTTIDRATLAATLIGRGTKIDNLVMVAHNCRVGHHSILVAQVGISGSTELGNYVTIAGQAGLVGHLKIGDKAVVAAQAGVTKDVAPGTTVVGTPAVEGRMGRLAFALGERLPEMKKALGELGRRVEALEEAARKGGGS